MPKSAGRSTFRSCMFSHNSYSDRAISPFVKEIMFKVKVRDIYCKRGAILWGVQGKFERLGRYEILGEKCNLSEQESRDMQLKPRIRGGFHKTIVWVFCSVKHYIAAYGAAMASHHKLAMSVVKKICQATAAI